MGYVDIFSPFACHSECLEQFFNNFSTLSMEYFHVCCNVKYPQIFFCIFNFVLKPGKLEKAFQRRNVGKKEHRLHHEVFNLTNILLSNQVYANRYIIGLHIKLCLFQSSPKGSRLQLIFQLYFNYISSTGIKYNKFII